MCATLRWPEISFANATVKASPPSTRNDRFEVGRYATHKSYVIPHQLMPELSRRFPYRVTDDDRCPAPDEGQQRLLDRGIKSARNDKRGSEATPHVKGSS